MKREKRVNSGATATADLQAGGYIDYLILSEISRSG